MAAENTEFRYPRVAGEQAARALRLEVELGFAPISGSHLWTLIGNRGADLAFHKFGPNAGDGLYLWNGERGLIVLNLSGRKATRLRFTAAHELGHHEMHRHTLSSLILSDANILQADTDVEKEANAFAAELLAPEAAIRRELEGKRPDEINALEVVRLMRTFGISYEAMLWRLFNSRAVTMADKERLEEEGHGRVQQLERALGFEEQEVFGPPSEALPEEYVLNTLHIYRDGAIDEPRLARLLRRDEASALRLAEEFDPGEQTDTAEIDELLGAGRRARRARA